MKRWLTIFVEAHETGSSVGNKNIDNDAASVFIFDMTLPPCLLFLFDFDFDF